MMRGALDIINHQKQPISRVVGQFIRTCGIAGLCHDVGDSRAGLDVDSDDAAASIGHEEPGVGGFDGHNAVGTGAIIGAGGR